MKILSVVTLISIFVISSGALAAASKDCYAAMKVTYNHDPAGGVPVAYQKIGTLCFTQVVQSSAPLEETRVRQEGLFKVVLKNLKGKVVYAYSGHVRDFDDNGSAAQSIIAHSKRDMVEQTNPGAMLDIVIYSHGSGLSNAGGRYDDAGWTGGGMANYTLAKPAK